MERYSFFYLHRFRSLLLNLGLYDDYKQLLGAPEDDLEGARHSIWFIRCILEVFDLSLLVYEGAHCGGLDYEALKQRQERIKNNQTFKPFRFADFAIAGFNPTQLCRHRLRCLDAFLEGRDVWVFKHVLSSSSKESLYISTDIETFADVWGPVWKINDVTSQSFVIKYNVGGGSLVARKFDAAIHPRLQSNECLCH